MRVTCPLEGLPLARLGDFSTKIKIMIDNTE